MKFLRTLLAKPETAAEVRASLAAPAELISPGIDAPFPVPQHLHLHEGLPIIDWGAALEWTLRASTHEGTVDAVQECKRAWLLHLRDALGYTLHESEYAFVLSPHKEKQGMLEFIRRTQRRIMEALNGVAHLPDYERQILVIFHDEETYYRYVSHAYPEDGEFAFSSGMFLHAGCPHFVTTHAEVQTIERVIAHEMTHASVAYLDIPLWLNEGLAVNIEDRLTGKTPKLFSPAEMHEKHLAFWTKDTIQEFWSGRSFGRPDDGSMLSYDLAQLLVEILAADWQRFSAFARGAYYKDSGASAFSDHFGMELGDSVASIFDQASADGWSPDPTSWHGDIAHTPE